MRFSMIGAIFKKEMTDIVRDRRTLISMVVVPLLVIPLLLTVMTKVVGRIQEKSEQDAKSMGIAVRVTTPAIRDAIEKAGLQITSKDDLQAAVLNKAVAAAVEEVPQPSGASELRIYMDRSTPVSIAAGERIGSALTELKDRK